jgi:hypothetical protein
MSTRIIAASIVGFLSAFYFGSAWNLAAHGTNSTLGDRSQLRSVSHEARLRILKHQDLSWEILDAARTSMTTGKISRAYSEPKAQQNIENSTIVYSPDYTRGW